MIKHRSIVLSKIGINEIGSDYSLFWKDRRLLFGYFKLSEIRLGGLTKDLKTDEKYYNERDKDVV